VFHFITHGDGHRGAERALRNIFHDWEDSSDTHIYNLGKVAFPSKKTNKINIFSHTQAKWIQIAILLKLLSRQRKEPHWVVFINGNFLLLWITILLIKLGKFFHFFSQHTTCILWEHVHPKAHSAHLSKTKKMIVDFLYRQICGLSDRICSPSPIVLSTINASLVKKKARKSIPMVLLPNPIAINYPKDISPIWPQDTQVKLLFVGSLTPEKQPMLAIEYLEKVQKKDPYRRYGLILCGKGPLETILSERIKAQHLPAKCIGHVDDLSNLYFQADLLICSSEYETFCNAIMEAILFDCQVHTTRWEGANEIYQHFPQVAISTQQSNFSPLPLKPIERKTTPLPFSQRKNYTFHQLIVQLTGEKDIK
jgi:glycosyltransferase involved in cell wall biosynthesis